MEIDCWLKGRKMTNFEKIRQLSEEEMAKYIFDLEMGLREIPYCGLEIPESMCTECVKKWLQQVDVEKG